MHAVVELPAHQWEQRESDGSVSIALITPQGSPHVMVRTEVTIDMPPERVFAFYMVRAARRSCCTTALSVGAA